MYQCARWEVEILCRIIYGMLIRGLREEVPVWDLGSWDPVSYHIWDVNCDQRVEMTKYGLDWDD